MNHTHENKREEDSLDFIEETARHLSTEEVLSTIYHNGATGIPMPSTAILADITEKLRTVLFPGYFGDPKMKDSYLQYHIGSLLDEIYRSIREQIRRGYCFRCEIDSPSEAQCSSCSANSGEAAKTLIVQLSDIRHLLSTDAQAAFEGDPAGSSVGETIFCYPSLRALTNYRIAHELYKLDVPLIPRIITEIAHSETGIDIHPGAEIGERFFIDHGTGVVIGETSVIGNNVRLYQGVTLGARSFPLDKNGTPIKGIDRHPILEDDVIIYSGATLLGRIRVGRGAVIGGNTWITRDVPPGSVVRANFEKDRE